jgi:hypothetical protein
MTGYCCGKENSYELASQGIPLGGFFIHSVSDSSDVVGALVKVINVLLKHLGAPMF